MKKIIIWQICSVRKVMWMTKSGKNYNFSIYSLQPKIKGRQTAIFWNISLFALVHLINWLVHTCIIRYYVLTTYIYLVLTHSNYWHTLLNQNIAQFCIKLSNWWKSKTWIYHKWNLNVNQIPAVFKNFAICFWLLWLQVLHHNYLNIWTWFSHD